MTRKIVTQCSVSECRRPHSCKGYCAKHYKHAKDTGRRCSVAGCERRYECGDYCGLHYARFRVHGDPLITKLPRGNGETFEERFWSRVDKTSGLGPHGDCWHWIGKPNAHGYGMINYLGKGTGTHRVAWMLTFGAMPQMHLLHSCDNPLCCKPQHLREGTRRDNTNDMLERERQSRGEHRPNSKLTEQDIRDIRSAPNSWGVQADLARKYGINSAGISRIRTGKIWRHVTL